jgi:hypothetical protein
MCRFARKFWRRFLDWLFEPVEFPGEWDVNVPRRKKYNRESRRSPDEP